MPTEPSPATRRTRVGRDGATEVVWLEGGVLVRWREHGFLIDAPPGVTHRLGADPPGPIGLGIAGDGQVERRGGRCQREHHLRPAQDHAQGGASGARRARTRTGRGKERAHQEHRTQQHSATHECDEEDAGAAAGSASPGGCAQGGSSSGTSVAS